MGRAPGFWRGFAPAPRAFARPVSVGGRSPCLGASPRAGCLPARFSWVRRPPASGFPGSGRGFATVPRVVCPSARLGWVGSSPVSGFALGPWRGFGLRPRPRVCLLCPGWFARPPVSVRRGLFCLGLRPGSGRGFAPGPRGLPTRPFRLGEGGPAGGLRPGGPGAFPRRESVLRPPSAPRAHPQPPPGSLRSTPLLVTTRARPPGARGRALLCPRGGTAMQHREGIGVSRSGRRCSPPWPGPTGWRRCARSRRSR